MNIEDRLSDALRPYREQPVVSLELWNHIEARTRRSHGFAWRWIAAGAIALVLVIVGFATIALRRDTTNDNVTAAAATREQFVEAANRVCAETKLKLDRAVVVFPTQTGFAAVADQVSQAATSALLQAQAFPVPDALRTSYASDVADLQAAVAAADRARLAAASDDLTGAENEINLAKASIARAGNRLAVDGAEVCRP